MLTACIAVVTAIVSTYVSTSLAQRRNVAQLEKIGGEFPTRLGPINNIQVWYDDDLQWNETEKRFEFILTFRDESGISGWISKTLGRDFAHCPVALEIDCHNFGCYDFQRSTFNQELVDQINRLPTVKQVWIKEWVDSKGELVNVTTNRELAKHLPNLIVASPQ